MLAGGDDDDDESQQEDEEEEQEEEEEEGGGLGNTEAAQDQSLQDDELRQLEECEWIRPKLIKESSRAAFDFFSLYQAVGALCPSKKPDGTPIGRSQKMKNADWVSAHRNLP